MKIILPLFFIFLFGIPAAFSQTKEVINDIKEKYTIITELFEKNELTQSTVQSNCESNGINDLFVSFYYNNDVLVYINYSYNQGHNTYDYHYYLWNNKLIFYFSDHASWTWDYGCAPKEQGFTNEIWTYEEQRVYFNNETPIKCLHKTYEESSSTPNDQEPKLSNTAKNKKVNCDTTIIKPIMKNYRLLVDFQTNTQKNICEVNIN